MHDVYVLVYDVINRENLKSHAVKDFCCWNKSFFTFTAGIKVFSAHNCQLGLYSLPSSRELYTSFEKRSLYMIAAM